MSDILGPVDDLRGITGGLPPGAPIVSDPDAVREPLRDVSSESGGEALPGPDHAARQLTLNAPMRERIAELQVEHRDLDDVIERLADQPGVDDLRLRRLKKRKLQIRDSLERLQMSITPDIPA
jgi:hypothetical protein